MAEDEKQGEAERAAAIAHMVSVLSDPKATAARKDRMALAIMQYGGGATRKGAPPSKRSKAEVKADRAKEVGERFSARPAPRLTVVKSA